MTLARLALFAAVPLALAGAIAQGGPAGYLGGATVDLTRILPPAPQKGEVRYETDRKVFKAMKKQVGGPRWQLALSDVPSGAADVMRDFSCATGLDLTPQRFPATYRLLANAGADTARANNAAKDHWRRLRPFFQDKGETCEDQKEIGKSYDYPSGHTTRGWTDGLILAELLPARATPILIRARAYGESRIVCRVHNMSAVEAGRVGATVTMESVRATPAYQADFAAARAELAAASAPAPMAAACASEEALVTPSVLAGVK